MPMFPTKVPKPKFSKIHNYRNFVEPSSYALRIEQLRNKIFGEPVTEKDENNLKIVKHFEKMPIEENKYKVDYYPPHPMFHYLMKMLRLHGLYRDEHLDFREEMYRLKVLRGKGRPEIGQGKRAKARAGGAK